MIMSTNMSIITNTVTVSTAVPVAARMSTAMGAKGALCLNMLWVGYL